MINIQNATVVKDKFGPDLVLLETNLPSSAPNSRGKNMVFRLDVAAHEGENYVKKHFPHVRIITKPV